MTSEEAIELIKNSKFRMSSCVMKEIGCSYVAFLTLVAAAGMTVDYGLVIKPLSGIPVCEGDDETTKAIRRKAMFRGYYD